jgi:hypothetical protein
MRVRSPLVLSLAAASVLAAVLLTLLATGTLKSTCGYGSGRSPNSCKSRPPPSAAELAAALDGSALTRALEALARTPDAGRDVVGVGVNRWGEVSFAYPTGETGWGAESHRFVRFGPRGEPLEYRSQSQYEDATGTLPFKPELASAAVLKDVLARVDRRDRFNGARLNPSFGDRGLAWTLTFVTLEYQADPQPASYVMAADGSGLCRMNPGPPPSPVPDCNLLQLPASTQIGGQTLVPPPRPGSAMPAPLPSSDPAIAKAMEQMACVKKAQGDVQALQRCVPSP